MPDARHRNPSRHHRRRRVARWLRALGPLFLLVAAGLLSAGVVHVVEVTTPARALAPQPPGSPATAPRSRIDFESFDDGLYQELQELERTEPDDLSLAPAVQEPDLLSQLLATSLLGQRISQAIAPFRVEIRASSLYEGPLDDRPDMRAEPRGASRIQPAPEPGTALLMATGLSALVRRATRII